MRLLFLLILSLQLSLIKAQSVQLSPIAEGLKRPVFLTHANDDRLFIVEQGGTIRLLENGQLLGEPFLDMSQLTQAGGERGLLGLAFHPDFQNKGYFFINYTDMNGDTQVVRYEVSSNPRRANPDSAKTILSIDQPYGNHNGGMLAFGPDGYLYIATGDGGSGGDPQGHGQNLNSLLGKILRLDVDKGNPYSIPADNPFVGQADARPEIWSYGWRNPWRFSFDKATGDLWVGDVGQGNYEEINMQAAGQGGGNYGWNLMEGMHCFRAQSCNREGLILPVLEYSHSVGNSVTGGYRYRGNAIPELYGNYLYADYARGVVWYAQEEAGSWRTQELLETGFNISSFGEDKAGELYLIDLKGVIYQLRAP